jgi:hypothetical protein
MTVGTHCGVHERGSGREAVGDELKAPKAHGFTEGEDTTR